MEKLMSGFTIYFADNVLVMLMATTSGTLGSSLFVNTGLNLVIIKVLGKLFNIALALILYWFAASRFHAVSEESEESADSGSEESSGEGLLKVIGVSGLDTDAGNLVVAVKGDSTSGYSHILQMLPWVVIVPMVDIPISLSTWIHTQYKSDTYSGPLFTAHVVMLVVYFFIAVVLGHLYARQADAGSKCESLPTFLLNCFNHSALSSTGKSLHLLESVAYLAIVGPVNEASVWARSVESLLLLALTWWLLATCWPRLQDGNPADKLFKSMATTITVYSWAYSFINNLWALFYNHIPHGQFLYWALMGVCLLVALVLAANSDLNFYGGPSRSGAAFGLMLCWVIDFGVWWAWAQIMTDVDAAVSPDGSIAPIAGTNVAILLGFLVVTSLVYICGDLQTMAAQDIHRHQHSVHGPKAIVKTSPRTPRTPRA